MLVTILHSAKSKGDSKKGQRYIVFGKTKKSSSRINRLLVRQ